MTSNTKICKPRAPKVSTDLWQKLYQIADRYCELKPWHILTENDIFAIRDPISGIVNYCCVLGEMGEFLGFTLYKGRKGLEMHLMLQNADIDPPSNKILEMYNAIVMEWCDKSFLEKEDLKVIKSLGPSFAKRKQIPHFQSYLPGYTSWFLTPEEVQIMTRALECAVFHIERCLKDLKFKDSLIKNDHYLLYLPKEHEEKTTQWATSWHHPPPLQPSKTELPLLDKQKVWALKSQQLPPDSAWEVSCFLVPEAKLLDNERPYYLRLVVVLHQESRLAILCDTIPHNDDPLASLRSAVISAIEKTGKVPSEICINNANFKESLKQICLELDIKLEIDKHLPGVDDFHQHLQEKILEDSPFLG